MNNHPLEQLDPTALDSDIKQVKKRGIIRSIFGMSLSKSKIKTKALTQSSTPQVLTQKSRSLSIVSHVINEPLKRSSSQHASDTNNKPLPLTPAEVRPSMDIFPENVSKVVFKTALPTLQDRLESTEQLVYCNSLMFRSSLEMKDAELTEGPGGDLTKALHDQVLDKAEREWLAGLEKEPMEQDRLRWLVARMVHEFVNDDSKSPSEIAEIVALGPILQKEPFRKLLSSFIKEFEECRILNVELLQGLVQLVQSASSDYLNSDDLVKILSLLRTRLQGIHQQACEDPYHLTLAVSRILDCMTEHKVKDLNRVLEHEPLAGVLSGLKDSSDPYLMYQACYAFQALQHVPDNEAPLQAVMRHSAGVVNGSVKASDVIKLDLGSVLEGLGKLQEAFSSTVAIATSTYDGVYSLLESGRGVFERLKEGLGYGQKRAWYPALRAAYALAQAGQLKDLKQLILEAPCRRDPLFQWGISQLLGEIAVDPIWATDNRQQAVSLLGSLYKDNLGWDRDVSVKTWMLTIIAKLGAASNQAVCNTARTLQQDLRQDQTATIQHPYPLRARFHIPSSSPILVKVQHIPYLEYELNKYRLQRLQEAKHPVYIPPMAKSSLQACNNDAFPLMDKVQEFLDSDCQVMIILGDSGAGKSTFNRHLELELLQAYHSGDPIPLFINLPVIDRPDKELITEHLKTYNFSEGQIQEMKQNRQFVVICDGYDESQLTANLHTTNQFNRPGQWRVKMVVSCRTQYLSQDYRGRFVPQGSGHYNRPALDLFQEAVIAPFSKEQIKDYVDQYVPLEPRTWRTHDYMHKLTTIPNLMDLVRNPFLLTLALEALPGVIEGKHDLLTITITRAQLYDTFVDHWIGVNKRRLENNILSVQDRDTLEQLLEAGFTTMAIDFIIKLALEIFDKQDGNPIVQYVHVKDRNTWRAAFFGPDPKVRLLRDSAPLSRTGTLYRFVHRSMLEYFFSRAVFDPSAYGDDNEFDSQSEADSCDVQPLDADGPLFKRNFLTEPSVIQFLCERVKQNPVFQQQLLAVIHRSKFDASMAIAATNAITILVRAGVSFNGADFRGIRIPGADLSNGWFDSVQLQGANLTGVNFSRSWLRKVDFTSAQMADVRFGELPFVVEHDLVQCCGYSPDGVMLALGLYNFRIKIFATATWTQTHEWKHANAHFTCLAFSPDSRRLVSGDHLGKLQIRNISRATPSLFLNGHVGYVTCVVFSPSGEQVASASEDQTVRLWNSETGECLFVLEDHSEAIWTVAYSSSGHWLVSGGDDSVISLWDTTTGEPSDLQISTGDKIHCLAWSLDDRQIASCLVGGCIQMWNAESGDTGPTFRGHSAAVTGVAFSPNAQWLASSSKDKTVRLWDASTAITLAVYSVQEGAVLRIAFSPDGRQICAHVDSSQNSVRLWEVGTSSSGLDAQAHLGSVLRVAYSPDGKTIISGSSDGTFYQWDSLTGTLMSTLLEGAGSINAAAFSPDFTHVATSSDDNTIRIWNCSTGTTERVLNIPAKRIHKLAISPCGRWIVASSSGNRTVQFHLWDLQSSEPGVVVAEYSTWGPGALTCMAFSPDGRQLAVGGKKGTLTMVDLHAGTILKTEVTFGTSALSALAYSSEGNQIAMGLDTTVCLRGLSFDEFQLSLRSRSGSRLRCISFSPCGQWIAICAKRGIVYLWRWQLGENKVWSEMAAVSGFFGEVESIQWNPRVPLEFVTGCADSSVRVWRIQEDEQGIKVVLLWGSGFGHLCLLDATFKGTTGLGPLNQKLLTQLSTPY